MAKEKKNKLKPGERRGWFKCVKAILRIFIKKPRFVFLGEEFQDRSLVLSNHVGASAPLTLETHFPKPFRFWGTYEMNSSLKEVYKYLSEVYFTQKKHWNKFGAKLFCASNLLFNFSAASLFINHSPNCVIIKNRVYHTKHVQKIFC